MSASAPTIIASRYRVLRELGRGGMGVVYTVEHAHTGDHLALKLLLGRAAQDPASIERFKREARASARIKSEHVVKVVDADIAPELDGAPFLVMELLNGTDLQKQLEQRGRFAADEAVHYLAQAARALDKSHGLGIIHRDLKPENLFLHTREDGSTILKILDFGISKIVGGEAGSDMTGAGMTSTGAVMGTPLYMSPEQARGRVAEIGPATDIWAMGLIGLQLVSGEVYWRANTVGELMAQIISEPLYAPSERWAWIPPAVDAWFARSCERDPKRRFASVGQQIDALAVALGQRSAVAGGVGSAVADASGQLVAAAAAASAPAIPGARTTTSATAREDSAPRPTSRVGAAIGAGAVALVLLVGSATFLLRSRASAVAAVAPDSGSLATFVAPASAPAAVAPDAAAAPPSSPVAPGTGIVAAASPPPITPSLPTSHAAGVHHDAARAAQHPVAAPPPVATPPPPAHPQPTSAPRFDPTAP